MWSRPPPLDQQPTQRVVRRQLSAPFVQGFVESFEGEAGETWYCPDEPRPATDVIVLVSLVLMCNGLGLLLGTATDRDFYEQLVVPSWAPASWLFAPMWSGLYTAMAVAAWLVWRTPDGAPRNTAMGWFAGQLVLSFVWTPIFFGAHALGAGLIVLAALFSAVAATTAAFWDVRRVAAVLMLPYLGWIGFATALNAAVWALNR
ncbi:MAG TPA: TspO/MBR family protein [Kofleriaceae bacterium]|nr:TspO/MBR family protein [Kofleriaceae bacterium]